MCLFDQVDCLVCLCLDQADLMSKRGINTPVCYACGLRNFKDLAYYYRKNIPNDELPGTHCICHICKESLDWVVSLNFGLCCLST